MTLKAWPPWTSASASRNQLIAFADVALEGQGQIAPEQREGEGVTLDLAARLLQLLVVRSDGRGAGPVYPQDVQQAGTIGLAQVAQIALLHAAAGIIRTLLVLGQVRDALAAGEQAQARLAGPGELGEQGLEAGGAQLPRQRAGRVLQGLDAVQHQQSTRGPHRLGELAALVPG
jgi:hypothetical protein